MCVLDQNELNVLLRVSNECWNIVSARRIGVRRTSGDFLYPTKEIGSYLELPS